MGSTIITIIVGIVIFIIALAVVDVPDPMVDIFKRCPNCDKYHNGWELISIATEDHDLLCECTLCGWIGTPLDDE